MSVFRNSSVSAPALTAERSADAGSLPRLTFEAARRAEAMGIVEPAPPRADATAIRQFANRVRKAGIASSAADLINNVERRTTPNSPACSNDHRRARPRRRGTSGGVSRASSLPNLAGCGRFAVESQALPVGRARHTDDIAARLHFWRWWSAIWRARITDRRSPLVPSQTDCSTATPRHFSNATGIRSDGPSRVRQWHGRSSPCRPHDRVSTG